MSAKIFLYDEEIRRQHGIIVGIDEAGRGPLAGPVVASAVILPQGVSINGLKDSKKVSEAERQRLFLEIVDSALDIGIGVVDAAVIDRINILEATRLAMKMAVEDLSYRPDLLLIDAVRLPDVEIAQMCIIKGESISASIAAASIVAKVLRDSIMTAYHEIYPIYDFKSHKGYPTKRHIESIRAYGPCPIHRRSFKRVRELVLPFKDDPKCFTK